MKPLVPVSPGTRVVLGVSFFVLFVAVWAAATFGGFHLLYGVAIVTTTRRDGTGA